TVENMPGAGSLIAANHLYKAASPDGLTVGNFIGSVLMGQVLGQKGIEFDARRFEYVGAPARYYPVCLSSKASGINSVEKWMTSKTPVKMGGIGQGTSGDNTIRMLQRNGRDSAGDGGGRGRWNLRWAQNSLAENLGSWRGDSCTASHAQPRSGFPESPACH